LACAVGRLAYAVGPTAGSKDLDQTFLQQSHALGVDPIPPSAAELDRRADDQGVGESSVVVDVLEVDARPDGDWETGEFGGPYVVNLRGLS